MSLVQMTSKRSRAALHLVAGILIRREETQRHPRREDSPVRTEEDMG